MTAVELTPGMVFQINTPHSGMAIELIVSVEAESSTGNILFTVLCVSYGSFKFFSYEATTTACPYYAWERLA